MALADTVPTTGSAKRYASVEGAQLDRSNHLYWSEQSEYYYSPATGQQAASDDGGRKTRHILISGWHPYEGFEDAVAQEAANAARHR